MTTAIVTRPGPADLFNTLGSGQLHREAAEEGRSLSAHLERLMPREEYKDGFDAFQRLFKVSGINGVSQLADGINADEFSAFDRNANTRALAPEWAARQWRKVTFASRQDRAILLSDAEAFGGVMRPYADAATARATQIAPAIPLTEMVAITTGISGDAYRSFYFTEPVAGDKRLVRVTEAAEIPRTGLTGGDHTIRLYKYGRALELSYETLRRQRIDKVAFWIARMAVQAETDKVATAIDVLINGDGNTGTAATNSNLTTLDASATAGTLTLKGWLAWKLLFANPYALTSALVQSAAGLQMFMLNVGSANVPLISIAAASGFGGFTPINPELRDNVRLGITTDAPTLKVLGFDNRYALERVFEIGSTINETDRWITKQVQVLTLSETEGYSVLDPSAVRTLDVNA